MAIFQTWHICLNGTQTIVFVPHQYPNLIGMGSKLDTWYECLDTNRTNRTCLSVATREVCVKQHISDTLAKALQKKPNQQAPINQHPPTETATYGVDISDMDFLEEIFL
ncbi:hypothetical protein MAR_016807 [Mya arenaria]|uniref:Uncharacterized protein n=1 Tax=Mya arenaria TaxID=6604 RepID=A0ABY7ECK5_MYAAR|nr:hypothetical protein MAR_016807 [Mya arenaria]